MTDGKWRINLEDSFISPILRHLNARLGRQVKKEIGLALVLGLIAMSMAPSKVFAADSSQSISGQLNNSVAPDVTAIAVTTMADVPEDNLDPQTNYKFKVSVTDNNTLADISTVELKLYVDNILLPDNRRNHYTFKFTAPGTWEEIGPDTDNRHLENENCVAPDNTLTSGDYVFVVKLDVIAQPGVSNLWDVYAKATDDNALTDELTDENKFKVNDYVSLTVDDAALTFTGSPGQENVQPSENPTVATVDTNRDFDIRCKVDNWAGSLGGTIGADNTKAAQGASHENEIILSNSYADLWTNVGYGEDVAENIYWFLNIPSSARDPYYTDNLYVQARIGD